MKMIEDLNFIRKQPALISKKREVKRICESIKSQTITFSQVKSVGVEPSLKQSIEEVIRDLKAAINEDRKTIILIKTGQSEM